ncbi:hypothetical protein IJD34_09940, partial [bacterium]|nr:hypothetical protein [bacterium]
LILLIIWGVIACCCLNNPIQDDIAQLEAWKKFLKSNGINIIKSLDPSVSKKILHLTNIFLTKHPKFIHIVLERAKLYENDNNYRAAEIDYLEYLNKFPTDKFVIDSYTAMTCRYKGKEFAITTLENFYRKIPKEQLYYCALANIYSEANEYDNAIMLINKAINLCPDDDEKAYFYSQRALIHLKNNNTELYEQDIKLRDTYLDEVFKNLST